MTEVKIDLERCKKCDLCLFFCPKHVFKEVEEKELKLIKPLNSKDCNNCGLCKYFCPEGAIILDGKSLLDEFWQKAKEIKEKAAKQNQPRGGWRKAEANFPGEHFIDGNTACVWGAIDAGCRVFAGYPITPASEQSYEMEEKMRQLGGVFIQMENEDASLAILCGASLAGAKPMTATSGPGFTRMQENLSFALTNELPMVIVDVQRTGPSTGRPTGTGAGEVREARWGSHGGTEHIVLYPSTVQEIYNYTVKAFNLAEQFRVPVILMLEASNSHLEEKIEIPKEIDVFNRIYIPGAPAFGPIEDGLAPSMPRYGDGEFLKVTGLTHNQWGAPCANDPQVQEEMIEHQRRKIISGMESGELIDVEEYLLEDVEILCVAYGHTARSVRWAIKEAREKGIKVGMLKLNILYPFPEKPLEKWSRKAKCVIVPEMNQGQLYYVVRESSLSPMIFLPQPDGEAIDPRRILKFLEKDLTRYYRKDPPVHFPTFYNPPEWKRERREVPERTFSFKTPFCPGCGLGILRNCLLEAIRELDWDISLINRTCGIGCTARSPNHEPWDSANVTHGYAVAFATGVKLVQPHLHTGAGGGDGDLFNIGLGPTIHGARRNIPILTICFNNFVFGMTGGQVAATTPLGAITSTTPTGNRERPFDLVKLMLGAGAEFVARCPISKPLILKKMIKEALSFEGFSFIEVVDPCLVQYGRRNKLGSPAEIMKKLNEVYIPKDRAKSLFKNEIKTKFKEAFPFGKNQGKIKDEELLQIVYGSFSSLREYISLIPGEKNEKGNIIRWNRRTRNSTHGQDFS